MTRTAKKGAVLMATLVALGSTVEALADMKITEVMYVSSHPPTDDPPEHNYWWELTNTGPSSVNLDGYSWDDNSGVPGDFVFPVYLMEPGESVIILERLDEVTAISDFQSAWGSNVDGVQVFTEADFAPGFALPGFGWGGVLYLFAPDNSLLQSVLPSPATVYGISNECLPGEPCRQSVLGENGAYQAPGVDPGDIGSPGRIPEPTILSLLLLGGLVALKRKR